VIDLNIRRSPITMNNEDDEEQSGNDDEDDDYDSDRHAMMYHIYHRHEDDEHDDDDDREDLFDHDYDDENHDPRDVADFRDLCKKIELDNDDEWTCRPLLALNDRCAVMLGKALIGNTTLQECCIKIGTNMTDEGVRYLNAGVLGSGIKTLSIRKVDDYDARLDLLSPLYVIPMQQVSDCTMSKVDSIRLEFHLDDDHAKVLGAALTGNQSIRTLEIDVGCVSDHEAAQALARGLCKSNVTTLKLQDKKLDYATPDILEIIYVQGVKEAPTIGKLCVYGNDGAFQALVASAMPAIHELELQCLSFNPERLQLLSHALMSSSSSIKNLSLIQCALRDEDMLVLSPGLGNCKSLIQLNLTLNLFGDAGVASFAQHWSPESPMELLDLSMNPFIRSGAVPVVLNALPSISKRMNDIIVSHCIGIGYDGLKLIGEALPGKRLSGKLDLEGTAKWISYDDDTSEEAIAQGVKIAVACAALVEGMRQNVYLKQTSVKQLHLPLSIQNELKLYESANRKGRQLVLQQDSVPTAIWCHLLSIKRYRFSSSLIFLFLRELPTLMMRNESLHNKKEVKRQRTD
jgi:hypothetical protein